MMIAYTKIDSTTTSHGPFWYFLMSLEDEDQERKLDNQTHGPKLDDYGYQK
jgi:hypothetical protein